MTKNGKVVITGATGMVGTHFVKHLLVEGYTNISVVVRSENRFLNLLSKVEDSQKEFIQPLYISLFDIAALTEAFQDTELLINCAAVVDLSSSDPQKLIEDNVRMTHCIAQAALKANIDKLVHTSSIATLTAQPYPAKTTENSTMTTLNSRSPYSISKFYSEGEIWRAVSSGLRAVVINPAVIIGEGNWRSGSAQFFKIIDKCPYFYTNGVMGYVSATDVARFGLALSKNEDATGKRFILCCDNLSYQELIKEIRISLGKNGIFTVIPDIIIKILIKFTGKNIFRNLIDKDHYDGTAAERASGIKYSSLSNEIYKIGNKYNNNKH